MPCSQDLSQEIICFDLLLAHTVRVNQTKSERITVAVFAPSIAGPMRGEYVASIFGSALANDRTDKDGADNVRILFHTHSCSVPQIQVASIISVH